MQRTWLIVAACVATSLGVAPAIGGENPCPLEGYPPILTTTNKFCIDYPKAIDLELWDLDADGDLELVYASPGAPVRVFRNDARSPVTGSQSSCDPSKPDLFPQWPMPDLETPSSGGIYDMVLADIDNDGDADLVGGYIGSTDRIYGWEGGQFRGPVDLDPDEESDYAGCEVGHLKTTGVYGGDVDQDGDFDLVQVYRNARPRLFLNRPEVTGDFDPTDPTSTPFVLAQKLPAPTDDPPTAFPGNGGRDVHLRDLDGDGDLDLIVARQGTGPSCTAPPEGTALVYRNDGFDQDCDGEVDDPANPEAARPFVYWYKLRPPTPPPGFDDDGVSSLSIELEDIDGDGDVDLVQPLIGASSSTNPFLKTRIYLNDGTGHLGDANHQPDILVGSDSLRASSAEVVDIDQDGDRDLIITRNAAADPMAEPEACLALPQGDEIWLNDGALNFTLQETVTAFDPVTFPNDDTRYVQIVDIDLDGDRDWIDVNFGGGGLPSCPRPVQQLINNKRSNKVVRP